MNRKAFFDAVRPMLPGKRLTATQVHRIEAVLNGLAERELPAGQAAYVLATAHHESDHWRTLVEYASGRAYEGRKDLGNTQKGDGVRFKGRGLVQITGRRNYSDWSRRLSTDFITQPDLVTDLKFAVPILLDGMLLGTFTGKKLSTYVTKTKTDFVNARRIINGTDKAAQIAGHAKKFLAALAAAT
jgi:hypothetical protein